MKFSIEDFFSKFDQIRRKLQIWSHLLKKSLMENFIFCTVTHCTIIWFLATRLWDSLPFTFSIFSAFQAKWWHCLIISKAFTLRSYTLVLSFRLSLSFCAILLQCAITLSYSVSFSWSSFALMLSFQPKTILFFH